jgi:hypothetical protein
MNDLGVGVGVAAGVVGVGVGGFGVGVGVGGFGFGVGVGVGGFGFGVGVAVGGGGVGVEVGGIGVGVSVGTLGTITATVGVFLCFFGFGVGDGVTVGVDVGVADPPNACRVTKNASTPIMISARKTASQTRILLLELEATTCWVSRSGRAATAGLTGRRRGGG